MQKKIRIGGIFISLLLAIGVGWWMYNQHQDQQLWGYTPLFFLLFAWAAIALILLPRFSRHTNNAKRFGLATLSGILLWLGFPMIPLTPLMFVAFIPLLMVEEDIAKSRAGTAKWEVFKYAYHSFVVWNLLTTYWVANTAFFAGLFAFLMNSFFMAIPFVLYHQVKKTVGRGSQWMAFIAFWITFEYLHMRQELTWPWLTLGNSFATFPSWVQWYEFTGVFGGSLWILSANALLFKWLAPKLAGWFGLESLQKELVSNYTSTKSGFWGKPVLLLGLPVLVSLVLFYTRKEKGTFREVVVIQPNFEPHYVKFDITSSQTMDRFLKLSSAAITPETEYLVFPESSFNSIRTNTMRTNKKITTLQRFIDQYPKLKLVTGLGSYKVYDPGEPHGPAVRTRVRSRGDTLFWESHNSAIQLTSGSKEVDFYLKSKLVPGAEIFPHHELLFFMKPVVDQLGGSPSSFATQRERSAFKSGDSGVAPVICFESVFGEYCTGYVKNGAEALFIVTNDGWWDNTAGHRQHLAFARLRAIELRRSIARSANTGISCFINQRGDVSQATGYDEEAAVRGSIQFNKEKTFYVQWGDLIGRVAGFVSILLILNAIVKGLMRKRASSSDA